MAWQKGPLPKDTYNWGAIVKADQVGAGFHFADFRGDHAIIYTGRSAERVEACEVALFDNSITMPPSRPVRPMTKKPAAKTKKKATKKPAKKY